MAGRRIRLAVLAGVPLLASGYWVWGLMNAPDRLLSRSEAALQEGDAQRAERLAVRVLEQEPASVAALLLAGESCFVDGRPQSAIEYLDRIPAKGDSRTADAHLQAGRLCDRFQRASAAERHFRRVLSLRPDDTEAHRELAWLLNAVGRRWDSTAHTFALVKQQSASVAELLLLLDVEMSYHDHARAKRYWTLAPDDPSPQVARALRLRKENRLRDAEQSLRHVVEDAPQYLEAHAWLGQCLYERGDWARLAEWEANLPQDAVNHPHVWVVRGLAAEAAHDSQGALRCYWEALRLNPDERTANRQTGLILEQMGRSHDAEVFHRRTEVLAEVFELAREMYHQAAAESGEAATSMQRAAELTAALGRYWESAAWRIFLSSQGREWHSELRRGQDLIASLSPQSPRTAVDHNPALNIDLSGIPLPRIRGSGYPVQQSAVDDHGSHVRFEDSAVKAGLEFRYFNNHTPGSEGMPLYKTTGGGVGAVDYDQDAWPDLYLTQGAAWPASETDETYLDQFYRNQGGRSLVDVTMKSRLGDERFSQGIAAGDFNNDGFDDLYLANLGRNRLYLNLGDGTFLDVAADAAVDSDHWTTSCAIADLNGDGSPDLYEVNYVDPHRADIAALCYDKRTESYRTCGPMNFPADQDRMWLSSGEGTFRDTTNAARIEREDGYGLGILVGNWSENGTPAIFVANDMAANHWWVNERSRGEQPEFRDQAVRSGLAFDNHGLVQACMGVASGDLNGDGVLDLFVSNFFDQANTLYLSRGETFTDATIAASLSTPSLKFLGFGTQCLDADLDGHLDLIVSNGHVDDYSSLGHPFKMRAQFFSNRGNGTFSDPPAATLGPFFSRSSLGRGVARLDWNRDGRDDVAISHIDDPAALLTNVTPPAGRSLTFRLIGVMSERDAFCTRITIQVGDRGITQQLTAGDGYQASNERYLRFALAAGERVEAVIVEWPTGIRETLGPIADSGDYLIVEGAGRVLPLFEGR